MWIELLPSDRNVLAGLRCDPISIKLTSQMTNDVMSEAKTSETAVDTGLGRKTLTNSLWSYLSFALQKGATFVATLILVRVLSPQDFGLMGYCLLAIAYLEVFSRFGLDAALISKQTQIDEACNVAFLFGLATGLTFFSAAWLAAPALAVFFHEDGITAIFRILALVLVIESVSIVHFARLQRELRFRQKLIPDIARGCVKAVVAVSMALAGFGVWSLVVAHIAGALVFTIILWIIVPWRPTLRFNSTVSRDLFRFGSHMCVINFIGALRSYMDYLLIGRILGTTSLGLYTISYRLPDLIIHSLNNVVGMVTHPILAQLQSDQGKIKQYYEAYIRHIAMLTLPAGVGIALVAEPFVNVFYTEAWVSVIFPMQCIALALAISSIGFVPGVLYKAINRPDILNYVSVAKLPFLVPILWLATGYGLEGVAIAQILLAVIYITMDGVVVRWVIGFGLRDLGAALWPSIVATGVMALITGWLTLLIDGNDLLELLLVVVVGAATYAGTLRAVARDHFVAALGIVCARS